jgi:hypothetical protein
METVISVPTDHLFIRHGGIFSQINYVRNGGGNAFMCKYWSNNHHIKVNLESLQLGKPCSSLGYRWNKLLWTSQDGESAWWWVWCSFPINIEGLILVTWWSMLDCCLTSKHILIHNNHVDSSLPTQHTTCTICDLLARAHTPSTE